MNERTFSRNFMKAWAESRSGLCYFKIPDVPATVKGDDGNWHRTGLRFSALKGVDYVVCLDGRFLALEWKFWPSTQAFPIDRLNKNQVAALSRVANAGGIAVVMIGGADDRNQWLYPLLIEDWSELSDVAIDAGHKSIRLLDYPFRIDRRKEGRRFLWPFEELEKMLLT